MESSESTFSEEEEEYDDDENHDLEENDYSSSEGSSYYSERDHNNEASESYYSNSESASSDERNDVEFGFDAAIRNTSNPSNIITNTRSSSSQESSYTDRADEYRIEFQNLLERDENGEKVDEDRLYFLELYARRHVGEELSKEEQMDLEEFEREEAQTAANKLSSTSPASVPLPKNVEVEQENFDFESFPPFEAQWSQEDKGNKEGASGTKEVVTQDAFQGFDDNVFDNHDGFGSFRNISFGQEAWASPTNNDDGAKISIDDNEDSFPENIFQDSDRVEAKKPERIKSETQNTILSPSQGDDDIEASETSEQIFSIFSSSAHSYKSSKSNKTFTRSSLAARIQMPSIEGTDNSMDSDSETFPSFGEVSKSESKSQESRSVPSRSPKNPLMRNESGRSNSVKKRLSISTRNSTLSGSAQQRNSIQTPQRTSVGSHDGSLRSGSKASQIESIYSGSRQSNHSTDPSSKAKTFFQTIENKTKVGPQHGEQHAMRESESIGLEQDSFSVRSSPLPLESPSASKISASGSEEKSVTFDMKKSHISDASLDLGDVFNKSEGFFDNSSKPSQAPKNATDNISEELDTKKKKRKLRRRRRKEAKSQALLDLVANVNDAMLAIEEHDDETKESDTETPAHRLLHGFDALVGIYLQLSDEIELISTFSELKNNNDDDDVDSYRALKEVLSFAESLEQLFADLKPILMDFFEEEPDEVMEEMVLRLNSLVDLLCETSHRIGERQEWNERVETTYVTLLELMELETLELQCCFEDIDVPDQGLSANIHEAWSATGHIEELQALQLASNDPWIFRQICYEVMVSTDQWCPDIIMLMEICGIDASMLEEEPDPEYLNEEELAPVPQAAEHVLDKINGDPLPRSVTLASILRRILPPRAMTDATLLDNFTSIRNTLNNPLGLSATNIVAISSAPEEITNPVSNKCFHLFQYFLFDC